MNCAKQLQQAIDPCECCLQAERQAWRWRAAAGPYLISIIVAGVGDELLLCSGLQESGFRGGPDR